MSNQDSSASGNRTEKSQTRESVDRRTFIQGAAASSLVGAAALSFPNLTHSVLAADDLDAIRKEIEERHEESVHRLQEWIRQPSIAAENRGMNEGCEMTMRFLRDAGFQQVTQSSDRWPTRNFRHARRRRSHDCRSLFHVRRKASRPLRMVLAPIRSAFGGQARHGQSRRRPRRHQSKRPRSHAARRSDRDQSSREEAARQHRLRRRRRRRNRLPAFPSGRSQIRKSPPR